MRRTLSTATPQEIKQAEKGEDYILTVSNGCNSSHRIKVLIAYGRDYACEFYNSGDVKNYSWHYPGRFDGLKSC